MTSPVFMATAADLPVLFSNGFHTIPKSYAFCNCKFLNTQYAIPTWLPLVLVLPPDCCEIPTLSIELRYSGEQQNSTTPTAQRHYKNKLQTSKQL